MNAKVQQVGLDELVEKIKDSALIISKEEQLNLIKGVKVTLEVRLGSSMISVDELFSLKSGSVVPLNTKTTDSLEILFNGKLVAKGNLVVVDDFFGIQVSDISRG